MDRFYKGTLTFTDGREFVDYWKTEESALSYYEGISKDNVQRIDCMEMTTTEDTETYTASKCIYEYDAEGKYYYFTGEHEQNRIKLN